MEGNLGFSPVSQSYILREYLANGYIPAISRLVEFLSSRKGMFTPEIARL